MNDKISKAFFAQFLTSALVTCKHNGEECIVLDQFGAEDGKQLYIPPRKFVREIVNIRRQRQYQTDLSDAYEWSVGVKGVGGYAAEFMEVCENRWLEYLQASLNGVCVSLFGEIRQATVRKPKRKTPRKKPLSLSEKVIPFPTKKGKRRR